MKCSRCSSYLSAFIALLWLIGLHVRSDAADAGLPADARIALEKAAKALQNVTVEFTELEVDPDVGRSVSPTDYKATFHRNLFYIHSKRVSRDHGKTSSYTQEVAHDGNLLYVGHPLLPDEPKPAGLTRYMVSDVADPVRTKRRWSVSYLDAAGFYIPVRITELDTFTSVEPLLLHFLKESQSTQIERENQYLRVTVRVADRHLIAAHQTDLERFGKYRRAFDASPQSITNELELYTQWRSLDTNCIVSFLLDPKYGYASIEREERLADGTRTLKVNTEGWKRYKDADIWMPDRCNVYFYAPRYSYRDFSDVPVVTNITSMSRISFAKTDTPTFALKYNQPGTVVEDRAVIEAQSSPKHQVLYTVAADGVLLRGVAVDVARELSTAQKTVWAIGVVVLLALPLLTLLYKRFSGKRNKSA